MPDAVTARYEDGVKQALATYGISSGSHAITSGNGKSTRTPMPNGTRLLGANRLAMVLQAGDEDFPLSRGSAKAEPTNRSKPVSWSRPANLNALNTSAPGLNVGLGGSDGGAY